MVLFILVLFKLSNGHADIGPNHDLDSEDSGLLANLKDSWVNQIIGSIVKSGNL